MELENKEHKDNINAGFAQSFYIYQYDDLKKISKDLIYTRKDIYNIKEKLINLERTLNPIIMHIINTESKTTEREKLIARHNQYDEQSNTIKIQMKELENITIKSMDTFSTIKDTLEVSDIDYKNLLISFINGLIEDNKRLKMSFYKSYKILEQQDKEIINNNLDRNFESIEVDLKDIDWYYSKCIDKINEIKSEIKNSHIKSSK
ncbi:hypothetical protein MOO46_05170 [Apilactobacillus apisilvae]|uniref:Uncharacterized protein n=1 Tax=Apilactobacillus apisilvae TaxID=2923364 RepID=A0ABY4PFR8_9LACO|nr:hypothetical protein [Apilactobacillus apisilvae]UQS84641.1 hypothetical protein MOO46_05170 [Apilactobacillus apisilvae]